MMRQSWQHHSFMHPSIHPFNQSIFLDHELSSFRKW
jgi:hypothetical protein